MWFFFFLNFDFKQSTYHQDPWGISANVYIFFGLFATHLFIKSRSDMNLSGNDILVARVPSREGEVYDVRGFESDMSEAIMHAQVRIKLFSYITYIICLFLIK